jgi:hypothetical protein
MEVSVSMNNALLSDIVAPEWTCSFASGHACLDDSPTGFLNRPCTARTAAERFAESAAIGRVLPEVPFTVEVHASCGNGRQAWKVAVVMSPSGRAFASGAVRLRSA